MRDWQEFHEKEAANILMDKVGNPWITWYINHVSSRPSARNAPYAIVPDLSFGLGSPTYTGCIGTYTGSIDHDFLCGTIPTYISYWLRYNYTIVALFLVRHKSQDCRQTRRAPPPTTSQEYYVGIVQ